EQIDPKQAAPPLEEVLQSLDQGGQVQKAVVDQSIEVVGLDHDGVRRELLQLVVAQRVGDVRAGVQLVVAGLWGRDQVVGRVGNIALYLDVGEIGQLAGPLDEGVGPAQRVGIARHHAVVVPVQRQHRLDVAVDRGGDDVGGPVLDEFVE